MLQLVRNLMIRVIVQTCPVPRMGLCVVQLTDVSVLQTKYKWMTLAVSEPKRHYHSLELFIFRIQLLYNIV